MPSLVEHYTNIPQTQLHSTDLITNALLLVSVNNLHCSLLGQYLVISVHPPYMDTTDKVETAWDGRHTSHRNEESGQNEKSAAQRPRLETGLAANHYPNPCTDN